MTESSQARTLRESVYWPALAASLPWRHGFSMLDRIARRDDVYAESTADALAGARSFAPIDDEQDWMRRYRLTRLVDHTDLFLIRTRGRRRWFDRHVDVEGEFPAAGPYIAMTFHWGAGLWAISRMHAPGVPVHFVSARVVREHFHGDAVAYRYALLRNRTVERAGGASVILTGGASAAIESALSAGHVVVALYDIPAVTSSTLATTVYGRRVELPAGMANIAMRTGVPVVGFDMGLDYRSGRRHLHVEPAFRPSSAQEFADRLGCTMTRLLTTDSAAWHFSGLALQFFGIPANSDVPFEIARAASGPA